jgi:hypothetical protein
MRQATVRSLVQLLVPFFFVGRIANPSVGADGRAIRPTIGKQLLERALFRGFWCSLGAAVG